MPKNEQNLANDIAPLRKQNFDEKSLEPSTVRPSD